MPTLPLAEAIADEWRAQKALIDPARMPLTRFANTAIDAVDDAREAVAADIAAYAGSDLLCYRAEAPEALTKLQAKHWDPIVASAEATLGAPLKVVSGVMPVEQPDETLAAFAAALTPHDAFRLTGLHVLTTLRVRHFWLLRSRAGELSPDAAWAAAHVDEDYQIGLWGEDAEAAARRRGAPRRVRRGLPFSDAARLVTHTACPRRPFRERLPQTDSGSGLLPMLHMAAHSGTCATRPVHPPRRQRRARADPRGRRERLRSVAESRGPHRTALLVEPDRSRRAGPRRWPATPIFRKLRSQSSPPTFCPASPRQRASSGPIGSPIRSRPRSIRATFKSGSRSEAVPLYANAARGRGEVYLVGDDDGPMLTPGTQKPGSADVLHVFATPLRRRSGT